MRYNKCLVFPRLDKLEYLLWTLLYETLYFCICHFAVGEFRFIAGTGFEISPSSSQYSSSSSVDTEQLKMDARPMSYVSASSRSTSKLYLDLAVCSLPPSASLDPRVHGLVMDSHTKVSFLRSSEKYGRISSSTYTVFTNTKLVARVLGSGV